jgi:hypothetical protein
MNIEQMLVPFQRYIEEPEVVMTPAPPIAQAPPMIHVAPMAQALPVIQTTHGKEPKFIMLGKFDGT